MEAGRSHADEIIEILRRVAENHPSAAARAALQQMVDKHDATKAAAQPRLDE
jgi:hypothetical protein